MEWSANLAYAIGLIATDGNLSKDQRHITLVSKDIEQLQNFSKSLNLKNKICKHTSSYNPAGNYYRIQFGNVSLYKFLLNIGLTANKSFTIGKLKIPEVYFADFLRGHLDGDGNISLVNHKESRHLQLRVRFASASLKHLNWLKQCIRSYYSIPGGFISKKSKSVRYLVFCKADGIRLLSFVYYEGMEFFLFRKYNYYLNLPK